MSFDSVRALLWDVDGTLIDTTTLIVAALDHVYLKYLGRTMPPNEIRGIIGIPLRKQVGMLGLPEKYGTTVAEMESEFIVYYESNRGLERVIPEVVNTLVAGKRAGFRTGIVTSKNSAELSNTLPRLGIVAHVDAIVSADDVRRPKPHPEGVLLALDQLGVPPEAALFIGDTVHDLRAGKAAGVRNCAVTWGAALRDQLMAENPELVCDAPSDLRYLLDIPDH